MNYIFIKNGNKKIVYSLRMNESDSIIFQNNQLMKIYLKKEKFQFITYTETMRGESFIKIIAKTIKGCGNIYVKSISNKSDKTEYIPIINNMIPEQGNIIKELSIAKNINLCTNEKVYGNCDVLLCAKSCKDEDAIIIIGIESMNRELILDKEEPIRLIANTTKNYTISDLSPIIELLEIVVKEKKNDNKEIKGAIIVNHTESEGSVYQQLNGKKDKYIIEFNAQSSDLSGNYTVNISAKEELNIMIKANTYSVINNHLKKVYTIYSGLFSYLRILKKHKKNTQVGFFTYYLGDEDNNDVAIATTPSIEFSHFEIYSSIFPWPSDDNDMWRGNIIKLHNKNYWYYFVVEANTTDNQTIGAVSFTTLETKTYEELQIGVYYEFKGTKLFRCKINKERNYVLVKTGLSSESLYLSTKSSNKLPYGDKYNYILTQEKDKIEIPAKKLKKTEELYITVYCHKIDCSYHLIIEEQLTENIKTDL